MGRWIDRWMGRWLGQDWQVIDGKVDKCGLAGGFQASQVFISLGSQHLLLTWSKVTSSW